MCLRKHDLLVTRSLPPVPVRDQEEYLLPTMPGGSHCSDHARPGIHEGPQYAQYAGDLTERDAAQPHMHPSYYQLPPTGSSVLTDHRLLPPENPGDTGASSLWKQGQGRSQADPLSIAS